MDPTLFVACAAALGAVVGSFLNVVIHRLPRGESVVRPGSRCPACGRAIRPWHNVPVLGWLALGGRCRDCGVRIPARYPLVEAGTAALFALLAWRFGPLPSTALWMAFAAIVLAAALIDFDHRIIPDELSLGGLAVGLGLMPAAQVYEGAAALDAWRHALAGAALGGGLLWGVGFVHARVCAAAGRRFEHWPGEGEDYPRPGSLDWWTWFPGMGFGDVKLLAMIGSFVGPVGVIQTIVAASLAGLVFGVAWALLRRGLGVPFGFGPMLAFGALLAALAPLPGLPLWP
ncbi:MAG: prepilin peptidase [Deltaproteobacteria bacterium]|nr:prepilin peptidase [Deltaproteobacteria bacterium]